MHSATHIYGDSLEDALQEFVDKEKIDWMVMVTHKKNFLDRLFNSSKTKQMSYHTQVPLLAIPAANK